jgi:hypothetical protein
VKRSNNQNAFSFERKRNFKDLKSQEKKDLIEEKVQSSKNARILKKTFL